VRQVKVSKSDYYRNEMDIRYEPPVAMQYGVNMNLIDHIPHQIGNSFVSMLSLFRKKPDSGQRRREFPIDDLADRLDPSTYEKREFWKKDFGVIMTHDVDTRVGYEYGMSKFVEMERAEDMVSTFNIVAQSSDYDISEDFIKSLIEDGFDFGMHGLRHDAKFPFLSVSEQKERIERAAVRGRELGLASIGYRAPLLHRTKTMIRHLNEAGYDWDSSFPDTDDSTVGYAATGSRTIFPFYPLYRTGEVWQRSSVLEIPVSMPQDWTLLYYYKLSEESMLRVWKKKMEYIKSRGGLAVFILHPDPEDFGHPKYHNSFRQLLKIIKAADPEILTCSELTERWKKKFPSK
jgi:peptidoglycan/xylan/chitin deacetylase (PgdA/CDA1 family)